ncbi:MAG: hypothetical protein AAGA68_03910 [Pseudomonadota bacterium]
MLRANTLLTSVCIPLAASLIASQATAQITPLDRLSFVSVDEAGLGSPPGGPDYYEESTSLNGTFDATLEGNPVHEQSNGATNVGNWTVDQYSTIDEGRIHATVSQVTTVSTDYGSPGIFSRSRFLLAFTVDSAISAELTGSFTGNTNSGALDYVQVLLKRNGAARFNTGFGDTLPYVTTLEPGYTYELEVAVSGEAEFNATVSSAASATLTLDPYALDSDSDGLVNALDNCTLVANPAQIDADGDGYGNSCDPDFDDSCEVDVADVMALRAGVPGTDPELDLNEDGLVNLGDFRVLRPLLFQPPGPSGLTDHCD